ncbi:MAG TPA: tRNA (guanosine(37)-N1)-methyltransferase TrmD [Verrucomicrobiae bacterium]|nr:tRNA (guanosine(37)-N1)-methyltransferase TrmD [Verrucomicrobiae bacterium]
MEIDVLTLFPRIFEGPLEESILKRAQQKGLVGVRVHNLRDFTHDKHRVVDDRPYGGGPGMLMKPEPIFEAVERFRREGSRVVLMTPQGSLLTQAQAQEFSQAGHLVIICGHYEGVDERVRAALVTDEVSIGDYVLTNGALAAAVFVDAVVRLLPGVLGDENSASDDSFASGLLEGPQYTRPPEFRGLTVPEVLLSGNHEAIAKWRADWARQRTKERRPDLWKQE